MVALARQQIDAAPIEVYPITPSIGAEIGGVDLRYPLTPAVRDAIRAALNEWRVLFFRDQAISNDQLIAFGRSFGPLTPAHPIAKGLADHPVIWERKAAEYKSRLDEDLARPPSAQPPRDYKGWHIDITFVANPNSLSILHGVDIPAYGGDTLFTNLALAYESLSAPIRTLIDGLQAVHKTSAYDAGKPGEGGSFAALHPVVRLHSVTGEKILFINPGTTSHIAGLRASESRAILDLLSDEITRPEYQVRFRWSANAIAVWDNEAVAHAGPIDYAQFTAPRVVRRITVAGGLPVGPDGFESRALEGELFGVVG